MQIVSIELYTASMGLPRPIHIAPGRVESVDSVIVRIKDDQGNVGWGEGTSNVYLLGKTLESVTSAVDRIAPKLLGEDPRRIERIVRLMDSTGKENDPANAALDVAIHDLLGKFWEEPLWRMLGENSDEGFETSFTITMSDPDEMAEEARDLVEGGFKAIKIKVGEAPDEDVDRVGRIREEVGEDIILRVDANQGWTRQEAVEALERMAEHEVEFVEQPVDAKDVEGLALVRRSSPIPVMADESICRPEDVVRLVKEDAMDYINVKLAKSGGLWKARRIVTVAEAAGVDYMVSGFIETDLALLAALHLAAAVDVKFKDIDMGGMLSEELIVKGGSKLKGNFRTLPREPGLGILRVNEDLLDGPLEIYGQ